MTTHRHKQTVKIMITENWDNAEVPNEPPAIRTPKTYDAIAVADWCYGGKSQKICVDDRSNEGRL